MPTAIDPSDHRWYQRAVFYEEAGSLFFFLFLLFVRYLPMIAMSEIKTVLPQAHPHRHEGEGGRS